MGYFFKRAYIFRDCNSYSISPTLAIPYSSFHFLYTQFFFCKSFILWGTGAYMQLFPRFENCLTLKDEYNICLKTFVRFIWVIILGLSVICKTVNSNFRSKGSLRIQVLRLPLIKCNTLSICSMHYSIPTRILAIGPDGSVQVFVSLASDFA